MVRPGSFVVAAALLIFTLSPATAWAHDWGGGAFIAAFVWGLAVPAAALGLLAGLLGGNGIKTFFGILMVLAILGCLGMWLLVVGDSRMSAADHATILAPIGLPLLAAWLCLRRPSLKNLDDGGK